MTAVDWAGKLEAADARGNTWPVRLLGTELDRKLVHVPSWDESMWVNDDGSVRERTWVIRNTPAPKVSDTSGQLPSALVRRIVGLVRDTVSADRFAVEGLAKRAAEIVAELPEVVDGDVEEAKCMALNAERDFATSHAPTRLNRLETHLLAAIRRGRQLEREGR